MPRSFRVLALALTLGSLAGCASNACDEFATPHDRVRSDCPAKPAASRAVPPDPTQPGPTAPRYCYASLGQVECYDKPQPGHDTGYMGTYDPGSNPPPVAPVPPSAPAPPLT
jgi:hypothetical protein